MSPISAELAWQDISRSAFERPAGDPLILVVSGWRGVGKTTYCCGLVFAARSQGLDVAGLLSPARFAPRSEPDDPLVKTGIEVEDLRSGQRRLLASRLEGELSGRLIGPWMFDETALAWGGAALAAALPCDLLVIDELGPLEFDQRQGWALAFDLLDQRRYRLAVVVVRPEYLARFQQRWLGTRTITL